MKIVLLCAGGASTSFLAANMRKAAKKRGIDAEINAYAFNQSYDVVEGADLVLVAPQAMYGMDEIQKVCTSYGVKCAPMDPMAYRMIDGDKLIDNALNAVKE